MPTRKDNTNVAPIYREQVFIPASGTTLMKQNARPKINGIPVASGAIEIVSPEFDLLTGIRGLANMVKPKTYKSIINNTDYNPTISEIDNAVNQGIQMGKDYINHPIVQATSEHNRQLFKRLYGKPQNMIYIDNTGKKVLAKQRGELLSTSVEEPIKYKFAELPTNDAGTYIRSKDGSGNFTIKKGLDNSKTKLTAFHETLHHGRYGNFDGIIYDIKAEKLYPNNSYLMAGHEAAANTAEVGRDMGLALGQKYPGRQVFRDMLDNLLAKPYYKDFVIKDAKLDTNRDYKRLWDALTGKYFTTAGAAATGLNLTNNDKMKCGGRRKAQLGLDIREGGIAIPIANNMFYINGRKHAAGGVAIGPNNKNGVEVEGGEIVEMIDSNHPSVGRQFKAGGQNQTMRVFSSVHFLRGASPAELVLGGANPDVVFKAQEEFKDRNRINDDGTMYKTGGIYIKPSKRGTFTAAATKHGMGVQEFASKVLANKEDYSPAMVKKANFARNASRWKKELGGSMIYTINGNVKNGLSLRPKAEWGKGKGVWNYSSDPKDFIRGFYDTNPYGNIYSDGSSYLIANGKIVRNTSPIFMDEAIKYQSNKRPQFYAEKRMPMFGEQSLAEKFGLARSGWSYGEAPKIDYVPDINISVPVNYVSNKSNSNKDSSKSSKPASTSTVEQPAVARRDEYYSSPKVEGPATPVDETYAARQARGTEAVKEALTYPKGAKTNEIDEPLIGKFKPFTLTDAISGLGNMVGSTASYFINRNLIDKYPMPTKPIMTPVVKLKTSFDVSGDIADIEESRRIAADAYKRNTSSSAAYLSRLQSGLNTAYRQKAEARRYGERMTNQLINADLQNRQNVYARNVAIQNDYYNRLVGTRQAKSQLEMQNLNDLIGGLTGGVTNIMSNIDTRANYNKMAQAIQAANPNVDPRLLGIYDYYEGKNTGKKYNKRGQLIN